MMVRFYVSRSFPKMTAFEQQEHTKVEDDILITFGGFTAYPIGHGVWRDGNGVRHSDVVDVYDIMVSPDMARGHVLNHMKGFAERMGKIHGQQCIPFNVTDSQNVFVEIEPDPNA